MSVDLISVVVPAYKSAPTLGRALASLSSLPPSNVIVVFDGPDYEAQQIAERFGVRSLVNDVNCGAPFSRNRGLAEVDTEYVTFLDADDYFEGNIFQGIVDAFTTDVQMVLSSWVWLEEDIGRRKFIPSSSYAKFKHNNAIVMAAWVKGPGFGTGAVAWKTENIKRLDGWAIGMRRNQDFELSVRSLIADLRVGLNVRGHHVKVDHSGVHRISRAKIADVWNDHYHTMNVIELSHLGKWPEVIEALAERYYLLATAAFRQGSNDAGRAALWEARRLGFKGHRGSLAHRVVSQIIGLEYKQRMSRAAHQFLEPRVSRLRRR